MAEEQPKAEIAQIVTILTTEHVALQSARATSLSDAQSRGTIFLTSVSSALVALALVGQISKAGPAFLAFAYVMFPTLYIMGIVTYLRAAQSSVEDTLHARGINRIRHYYIEIAPQIERYFIHSHYDDIRGLITDMGVVPRRSQTLLTTSATLGFISSVLLAVWVGILLKAAFGQSYAVAVAFAIVALLASMAGLLQMGQRMWQASEEQVPPIFPSP